MDENEVLDRNTANKEKSTGSMQGSTGFEEKDDFLAGFGEV